MRLRVEMESMMGNSDPLGLLLAACAAPGMFVEDRRFVSLCAFITGYDLALQGAPLLGFWEWLIVADDRWSNLTWSSLVRRRVFPGCDLSASPLPEEDAPLIAGLGAVLAAFASERRRGLPFIFHAFNTWLSERGEVGTEDMRARLQAIALEVRTRAGT